MDGEELDELTRSLQRLTEATPHHFVWVPAGDGREPLLHVSPTPIPTSRQQALRRDRGATFTVGGVVALADGAARFTAERADHGPFQRHVRQLAGRVPRLASATFVAAAPTAAAPGAAAPAAATPRAPAAPPPAPDAPPPARSAVPPILADLLRTVGPPGALRDRASRAIQVAGEADRRVGRAMGVMMRSGDASVAGREELDALNTELARLAEALDADIASVNAALRALDQSLPERVETEADQARITKLREASSHLGGVVRTQQGARARVGEVMRLLGELDETFSALATRSGVAEGE